MADDKSEEVEVPPALLPETAREAQLLKKVFGETSAVKRRGVRAMMLLEQVRRGSESWLCRMLAMLAEIIAVVENAQFGAT